MCPLGMAISIVRAGEQKSEIASQVILSSRAERNVPSGYGDLALYLCHRERSAAISVV